MKDRSPQSTSQIAEIRNQQQLKYQRYIQEVKEQNCKTGISFVEKLKKDLANLAILIHELTQELESLQVTYSNDHRFTRLTKIEALQKKLNFLQETIEGLLKQEKEQEKFLNSIYPANYFRQLKQLLKTTVNIKLNFSQLIDNISEDTLPSFDKYIKTLTQHVAKLKDFLSYKTSWQNQLEQKIKSLSEGKFDAVSDKNSAEKIEKNNNLKLSTNRSLELLKDPAIVHKMLVDCNLLENLPLEEVIRLKHSNKEFSNLIQQYWQDNPSWRDRLKKQAEQWFIQNTSSSFVNHLKKIINKEENEKNNSFLKLNWVKCYEEFQQALQFVRTPGQLPFWIKELVDIHTDDNDVFIYHFSEGIANGKIDKVWGAWLGGMNLTGNCSTLAKQWPLTLAVLNNQLLIAKWFLNTGIDPDIATLKKLIHIAASTEMKEILQQELNKKIKLSSVDNKFSNPLKKSWQYLSSRKPPKYDGLKEFFRDRNITESEARKWFQTYMPELAKKLEEQQEQNWIEKRYAIDMALRMQLLDNLRIPTKKIAASKRLAWLSEILNRDPFIPLQGQTTADLINTVKQDDTEKMIYLLIAGISRNCKLNGSNKVQRPLLHFAVGHGQLKAASFLLEEGEKIDSFIFIDGCVATPFNMAAARGQINAMEFLLSKDNNLLNTKKATPALFFAAEGGHLDAINYLLNKGAVGLDSWDEMQGIFYWASSPAVVDLLVQRGAKINFKNKYGITPLQDAVAAGNINVVKALLKYGARTDIKDNSGFLPFDVARDPAIKALLKIAELMQKFDDRTNESSFNFFKPFLLSPETKANKNAVLKKLKIRIEEALENNPDGENVDQVINAWLKEDSGCKDDKGNSLTHEGVLAIHRFSFFSPNRKEVLTSSEKFVDEVKGYFPSKS